MSLQYTTKRLWIVLLGCVFVSMFVNRIMAQDIDMSQYHDTDEVARILKQLQRSHAGMARLISAGKSLQGRDLWVLEISNRRAGKPEEKPAVFVCGGLRGDEAVGTEAALYTAWALLDKYKGDSRVESIVDNNTFYIWPTVNPDACDATIKRPGMPRIRNFRPSDDDHDGKVDEDPPDDIDRDGFIAMMRMRDEDGKYRIDPQDARILLPVQAEHDTGDTYRLIVEGIDDDGDGKYNEDAVGGVDLNHNFPSGWRMEFQQPGAGMYAGSEPESEALIRFLIEHPNVAVAVLCQAGEGVLYRPFDHLSDKEIPRVDMIVYERFGEIAESIFSYEMKCGYPMSQEKKDSEKRTEKAPAGESDYGSMPPVPASKTPPEGSVKSGTLIDWIYKDYNVYALSPSLWTLPETYIEESTSSEEQSKIELAWLDFMTKEWAGEGFIDWKKTTHPQLGAVEIGGWSSFHKKNPPPGERLKKVCENQSEFVLALAEMTPRLSIRSVEVNPIQILKDPTNAASSVDDRGRIIITKRQTKIASSAMLAEVKITVENIGSLGTRSGMGVKTRYSHQPPRSVLASLEARDGNIEILSLPKVLRLGVIEGSETKDEVKKTEKKQEQEKGDKEEEDQDEPHIKTGKWLIKMNGSGELVIRIVSEKGGSIVKRLPIQF